ncbi:NAD-dependent succinate-semialdehyde dehydrogenase [Sphingomonas yantingensis]|uniref:Succinate-semialdehyde dehydrogenase/glutarate-semialdehyde dehydrogenase n=1 Tax=Sphingomonas yantingensis TaxID=1241761 RepID=A0A7W9ANW7_9SPHN|nr:NAD-dependent succinate-semialdehyde dehydrogenase [Sphingomonas yantingensis]MBB5697870.1 succinate-semialdehyde dehydrogenase/glutarate-semialdehyde dehydrogenase [Sphingomonas yantingensis]
MFETVNPATGEARPPIEELDAAGIEAALATAHAAYKDWRLTSVETRTDLLSKIAEAFEANKDRLAHTATEEMGKTLKSAIAEVEKCAAGFRYYAEAGPDFLKDQRVQTKGGHAIATWQPIGIVLAVMPWNFPYWQVVRFLAPAILAGNVGLLKHASITQGCGALIEEMVRAAGAPEGLFTNLPIKSGAVEALIADDRVAAVTLTGSEGAGQKVAEAAGRALKKVVLELGGSDPFIVLPSADLDEAAKVATTARIQNAGQSCICAKRMIVHADVFDAFLDKFSAAMRAAKVGDPMDEANDIGPLSSFEQRDTVIEQVARAREEGARLLFGAEKLDLPGAYLTPGILLDVDPDSDFAKEELFGPVAMVFRADDLDAAIALANDVPFGLGSSIWTNDEGERERLVRDLECGMVAVNQMVASVPEAPFGGIKRSGHGRELGPWGMHEFMNLKAVLVKD